jgi:uncharacterized protein YecE (DUF72 family)
LRGGLAVAVDIVTIILETGRSSSGAATRMPGGQLSLFGDDPGGPPPARRAGVQPAAVRAEVVAMAAALPAAIRLGASSWSFPGWTGLVYAPAANGRPLSEATLAREGLAAYAAHPLLRTVSLDRTFYAPLPADAFARYAADVPEAFRFVVKAPAAFTDPVVRQPGSGMSVRDNPTFLDAAAAAAAFVQPARAGLGAKAGPLVFQFPPLGRRLLADVPRTIARIAAFMTMLARGPAGGNVLLAVEVRDPELCTAELAAALRDANALPCLAVHARMPPVAEQAVVYGLGRVECPWPIVARWNLHAGRAYEEARADYFPFDRLVEEDEPTRAAVASLAARAAARGREVFVTINNKAEGSAPHSVLRLAEAIVAPGAND